MLCIVEILWGKKPVTSEGKNRVTESMNDQLMKGDHKLNKLRGEFESHWEVA